MKPLAVGGDEWGGLFVNSMKRSGVDTKYLTVKGRTSYTGRGLHSSTSQLNLSRF